MKNTNYPAMPITWLDFRTTEAGKIKPYGTANNLNLILDAYGITCRYNIMTKSREIHVPISSYEGESTNQNVLITRIKDRCKVVGFPVADVDEHIDSISESNCFHPVLEWIGEGKNWDGVDRLTQLINGVIVEDDMKRLRDVFIKKWLLSAIHAMNSPRGAATQGVVVFTGAQGIGKSTWGEKLLPSKLGAVGIDVALNVANKDSVFQSVRYLIAELGEIDGCFRKSDIAALKGFITRKYDEIRLPYRRDPVTFPRQTIFFGSVNDESFLCDPTGNRRFWVIKVLDFDKTIDIDIHQLWKQLSHMYHQGADHNLTREENGLLNESNKQFTQTSSMEELLTIAYKPGKANNTVFKNATEILIDLGWSQPRKIDTIEMSRTLKACGFTQTRKTVNGSMKKGFALLPIGNHDNAPHGTYTINR